MSAAEIIIKRPDDWHVHLRDGAMLKTVLPYTAKVFGRAIVMPNLPDPVTTRAKAAAYRKEIEAALDPTYQFTPLMTCYLTDTTDVADLKAGFEGGVLTAAKLYPAHATTNSAAGVTDVRRLDKVFAMMSDIGMPLLVHGEVTDPDIDIFDREKVFLERILHPLRQQFPKLKIVLEHITTTEAADYVQAEYKTGNLAATVTAHHLIINRTDMFQGGIRPHFYCLPVAKREHHREALVKAITTGCPAFFLGTDSAPHTKTKKESDCGCAGIFTAPLALELYAAVFEAANAMPHFEGFASLNGPKFYGLPTNSATIRLVRVKEEATTIKPILTEMGDTIVPFHFEKSLPWRVVPTSF
jgi:dihydroorotase